MEVNVWRIQLKPDKDGTVTYQQLLDFCLSKGIIGVGWTAIKNRSNTEEGLWEDCQYYEDGQGGATRAYKALHAMYQMKEGDLIWTRLGKDASDYYLCRVGKELWKACTISDDDQKKYDIGNAVSAQWIKVGKQSYIPGKVINSFIPAAAVQRVNDVATISTIIWNELCPSNYPKYPDVKLTVSDFWNMIDSEELECLVLLYLQTKGYYIYSSTTKLSNPKYEAVMVAHDGSHLAFPQVKRNEGLEPSKYAEGIDKKDKVFLFTTSEKYGEPVDNVVCISRNELYSFATEHRELLTDTVRRILNKVL